jgi:hypothetical protein
MKFVNFLTIASLFVSGSFARCIVTDYKCCSGTNVEVLYTDETGDWSVENNEWCFIDKNINEPAPIEPSAPVAPATPIEPAKTDVIYGDTFDSMFIGAWVGGPEKLPEYPQPNAKNVATYEALQDRHLDIIHLFVIWQYNDFEWARQYLDVAKQNGSITMVTWMPTPHTAQDILDGKADEYINEFAAGVKSYGEEIWMRPLHESNGNWYTWGTGADSVNNAEDKVAAAYRYIVDIFRNTGVENVKWVWTTNNGSSGGTLTGSYPGDDYVDYVSIDGYNWGTAQSWSKWNTFEEVFTDAYTALCQYNKPMFLAEFSSSELGGNKAEWIDEMFRVLPVKFPRIIGLVWFSESKPDNEGDWGLDTSEEAVEAWKRGIRAYPPAKRINH